jgi:hypothetical protein
LAVDIPALVTLSVRECRERAFPFNVSAAEFAFHFIKLVGVGGLFFVIGLCDVGISDNKTTVCPAFAVDGGELARPVNVGGCKVSLTTSAVRVFAGV